MAGDRDKVSSLLGDRDEASSLLEDRGDTSLFLEDRDESPQNTQPRCGLARPRRGGQGQRQVRVKEGQGTEGSSLLSLHWLCPWLWPVMEGGGVGVVVCSLPFVAEIDRLGE